MGGNVSSMMKIAIGILIAVVLVGPIATTISTAVGDNSGLGNSLFASSQSIIVLVPLGIVAGLVWWGYTAFTKRGGGGGM